MKIKSIFGAFVLGLASASAAGASADYVAATNALVSRALGRVPAVAALSGTREPVVASEWRLVAPIAKGDFALPYGRCWIFQIDSDPLAQTLTRAHTVVVLSEDLSEFVTYASPVPVFLKRRSDGRETLLEPLNDGDIPRAVAPRTADVRGLAARSVAPLANTENNTNLFAVLISGGANPVNNGIRFYNDVRDAYQTLKEKCAIPRENIFTFVASGVEANKEHNAASGSGTTYVAVDYDLDGDGTKDVTGGANETAITNCLAALAQRLTAKDRLLVVLSTHGTRVNASEFTSWETVAWLWNEYVWDDEFRAWTDGFACPVAFALQQCFSGGFADDLVLSPDRVVGTAANHLESSWGYTGSSGYNLYLHNFFAAVASGSATSFYEAALAAYGGENLLAHPQYAESTARLGHTFRFDALEPPAETCETVTYDTRDADAVCLMTNVDYRAERICDWMPDAFSTNGYHEGWTETGDHMLAAEWIPCAMTNGVPLAGLAGVAAVQLGDGASRCFTWTAPKDVTVAFSLEGSYGTGSLAVSNGTALVASDSPTGASWARVAFEVEAGTTYTVTVSPSSADSPLSARVSWHAEEWYVDASTGDDANDGSSADAALRTIQAAIDRASAGATIHVAPGRYAPIASGNKAVTIVSDEGAEETFIDGGGTNACANLVSCYDNESATILIGFTLENGFVEDSEAGGAGVHGGTLRRCVIRNCVCRGSTEVCGVAAFCGVLSDCLVYSNAAVSSGSVWGGACYATELLNCTVADNTVEAASGLVAGGGLYVYSYYGIECGSAVNSIVVGTRVSSPAIYGANIYDSSGERVVKTRSGGDPKFVDRVHGDYRLAADSPCIDAGYGDLADDDVDLAGDDRVQGGDIDLGCYESAYTAPDPVVPEVVPTRGGRHYGVFVGINEFAAISSLNGCIRDAENVQSCCLKSGLWHAEDTSVFTNACATESAVRAAIAAYAAEAQAGDTFVYMQSSHGGNDPGEQTSAFLCMYDCRAGSGGCDGYYYDTELAEDLLKFPEGVRVIVYADACRSGGLFKSWDSTAVANSLTLLGVVANVEEAAENADSWNFAARVRTALSAPRVRVAAATTGARVLSGTHVDGSVGTNIAFVTAADYDQYSFDVGASSGGAFTAAFVDGWTTGDADDNLDAKLDFYELYCHAASVATGNWTYVDWRTEAQCDNAALLAATLAGYPPGVWPEPEVSPTDTPEAQAAKVQDALIGAGFPPEKAAAVTNAEDYAALRDWATEQGVPLSTMAASPTALFSPAIGAEGLVSEEVASNGLASATSTAVFSTDDGGGTVVDFTLSLSEFGALAVNESLLKASVGVVGADSLGKEFTADDLSLKVEPQAESVRLTVTPPSDATTYFLKTALR